MPQSIPDRLSVLADKYFPDWTVVGQIGSGSFSRVYRAQGKDGKQAALKWIEYPEDKKGISELRARGASEEAVQEHRKHTLTLLLQEIQLLKKLHGTPNIIELYDFAAEQTEDSGVDLLILMELSEPLPAVIPQMAAGDVCRLGQDICKALVVCEREKIMHRDIKPENIFRSPDGAFQLGDFGVARRVAGEQKLSVRGTPLYMAPEVQDSAASYDHRVDIYSLGLVMYELLNAQCPPFVEARGKAVTTEEEEKSISRRLAGDPLPAPVQAPESLARVILRACSFDPEDRYDSAEEMLQDLQRADAGAGAGEKLRGLENRPMQAEQVPGQAGVSETQRAMPRSTVAMDEQGSRTPPPGNGPGTDDGDDPPPEIPPTDGPKPTVNPGDNPFKEIWKNRAKRRKMLLIIACAAALTAAIVIGLVLYINGSKQMTNLRYTQDGTLCAVSWQNGGGSPWQAAVIYKAEGTTVYEESLDRRNLQVRLIPGEEYALKIGEHSLDIPMERLPGYSGEIQVTGTLCSNRKPQEKTSFSYSRSTGENGQAGYEIRLRYQCPPSGDDLPAEALCLIQYGSRITEQAVALAPSPDGEDAVVYISLNEALKQGDTDSGVLLCNIYLQDTTWYEGRFEANRRD